MLKIRAWTTEGKEVLFTKEEFIDDCVERAFVLHDSLANTLPLTLDRMAEVSQSVQKLAIDQFHRNSKEYPDEQSNP